MMRKLLASLLLALSTWCVQAGEALPMAEDEAVEQRLVAIAEELRCLVCQNESLAGSRADLAQDLRREVRTLIKAGKSDDEIRQFLVTRYGDFVLYRPRVSPMTYLLWGGPFLFGDFGAADAMFAPVALRFRTYEVELPPPCRAYADALLALAPMREWIADSEREAESIPAFDMYG